MLLMNGKEVNHLIINGEAFDKSYSAGVKARVTSTSYVGTINKNGDIISEDSTGGRHIKSRGSILTVICIYKNVAAYLADDDEKYTRGSWISLNDIEFID